MWEIFEGLLKRDGVSIAEVSRATGISQSVFSNWKKRNSKLSAENAMKIADYFGVTVGFLMGVQEDVHHESYYKNVKSALMAQQMFEDPQLHALFHVKQNIDPSRFQAFYDMVVALYRAEHPDDNYDFNGDESSD
jgi:transcriptional regulator with XRE-family HTH domain